MPDLGNGLIWPSYPSEPPYNWADEDDEMLRAEEEWYADRESRDREEPVWEEIWDDGGVYEEYASEMELDAYREAYPPTFGE